MGRTDTDEIDSSGKYVDRDIMTKFFKRFP